MPQSTQSRLCGNRLLAGLDGAAERLLAGAELQRVEAGDCLIRPGETIAHAFFPSGRALLACSVEVDNGVLLHGMLVGNAGLVGAVASTGPVPLFGRVEAQSSGALIRIAGSDLEAAKLVSRPLRNRIERYAACALAQLSQAAACNILHSAEQRAARWLIELSSTLNTGDLDVTQEQLARMLGVGRSYVSRLVQSLRDKDMLTTRRGGVVLLDVRRLATISCGCGLRVARYYQSLMAGVSS